MVHFLPWPWSLYPFKHILGLLNWCVPYRLAMLYILYWLVNKWLLPPLCYVPSFALSLYPNVPLFPSLSRDYLAILPFYQSQAKLDIVEQEVSQARTYLNLLVSNLECAWILYACQPGKNHGWCCVKGLRRSRVYQVRTTVDTNCEGVSIWGVMWHRQVMISRVGNAGSEGAVEDEGRDASQDGGMERGFAEEWWAWGNKGGSGEGQLSMKATNRVETSKSIICVCLVWALKSQPQCGWSAQTKHMQMMDLEVLTRSVTFMLSHPSPLPPSFPQAHHPSCSCLLIICCLNAFWPAGEPISTCHLWLTIFIQVRSVFRCTWEPSSGKPAFAKF